jgi:regulator of protease activity HflC (stomatin/prohibitin superfamily)
MLGVRFMKAPPTTYVLHFANGRVRREGAGLSFFYWAPGATIVTVPVGSADAPFAFQEATADFRSVAIQGQVTYRVTDPRRLAAVLDLSLGPGGRYRADDYQKLPERIVHTARTLMRAETQRLTLAAALTDASGLGARVLGALRAADAVVQLGVEILGLSVLAVRPTPESAKALEAEAREALQRRSDEAIHARRNAAVEHERRIKESELQTEMRLVFVVREPFVSRHSAAGIVTGVIAPGEHLEIASAMPAGGVIFSDGVEADHLAFDAGATATVGAAPEAAHLVVA